MSMCQPRSSVCVLLHKYSCPTGTLSTLLCTVVKVGGSGMGQGPATEASHLGLN